jgi:hypothetical protein
LDRVDSGRRSTGSSGRTSAFGPPVGGEFGIVS